MVDATISKKHFLAIALATVAVLAVIAAPAYAFYYVHGVDGAVSEGTNGAMEVLCTVDETANGGTVWTGLVFVPVGSTPADVAKEMMQTSESQNGVDALHDYSYDSIEQLVSKGNWTCTVYAAESQAPGTQTERDADGTKVTDLGSTTLQRYDSVVFTAE